MLAYVCVLYISFFFFFGGGVPSGLNLAKGCLMLCWKLYCFVCGVLGCGVLEFQDVGGPSV